MSPSTRSPGHCAACISSSRRRPRRRSCAAHAARSSTSSSTFGPRARPTCSTSRCELDADNGRALYVPERFAHGYQTLVDATETSYLVGEFYTPEAEGGLRCDDPRLASTGRCRSPRSPPKDAAWERLDEVESTEVRRRDGGARVIIVDTALEGARGRGTPDSRRHCRRRVHGTGADEPDRQQRSRHARRRHLEPTVGPCRRMPCAMRASSRSESTRQDALEDAIRAGGAVFTDDPFLLCRSEQVDVICEITGSVEFGAQVGARSVRARQGRRADERRDRRDDRPDPPRLRRRTRRDLVGVRRRRAGRADRTSIAGSRASASSRASIGNVKGLQDPYRNPTTQKGFAEKWGQNPAMVTSFADGSKISFEQAIVANATGFTVLQRGMSRGLEYRERRDADRPALRRRRVRELGGIVDYVVGTPLTKVYCLAEHADPKQQHYLISTRWATGRSTRSSCPTTSCTSKCRTRSPASCSSGPVSRALGGPVVEVCAVAKRDLKAGETLDDYGEYMTYGEAVSADEMSSGRLLPEGLVEGCVLRRDIKQDELITYATSSFLAEGSRIACAPSSTSASAARRGSQNGSLRPPPPDRRLALSQLRRRRRRRPCRVAALVRRCLASGRRRCRSRRRWGSH